MYDKCVSGYLHDSNYSAKNGLLFWKDRLVIPSNDQLKHKIFYELHVNKIGGHAGIAKIVARIVSQFYWPHMHADIRKFVRDCSICQQAKSNHVLPTGLLNPLPIPNQVRDDIALDFITHLLLSHGYTSIMVVVDRLSKFAHFISLKTGFTSKIVVDAFINNVAKFMVFQNL